MRTLSRFALIGLIGGGTAACSSDASRLGNPFTNPFSSLSGEPSATGSLPDEGAAEGMPATPAIRTPRVQTQSLGAPAPAMSSRPMASTPTRVASAEPAGAVDGMNPSGMNPGAGRAMSPRQTPAPKLQFTPGPKADKAAEKAAEKAADAKREEAREGARKEAERKVAEARKAEAAAKAAEAKAAESKAAAAKAAESKKVEAKKEAEAKKHVRPGQKTAEVKAVKAEGKPESKADPKAEAAAKAKADAKLAETRKAESEAKLAKAEAAKRVAEAKAAEAAAKTAAKQTKEAAKEAAKEPEKPAAPVKVASAEPATTASVAAPASNESFRWPAKGRVINGYGSSGNEGINIAVPEGTPVKAAEDGTVAYAGSDVKGYGKLVLVRHTNGYVSAYAHNGELDVRPGEKVKRGQTIAKSGATGNVTSPQLHFEIRKGATPVDPMPHLASN